MGEPIKFDAYKILNTGTTLAVTTTSARTTLPTTGNGVNSNPSFVRLLPEAACYVKFGDGTVTATLNDILVQPNMAEIFSVRGCTNIAAITRTGTANLNVTPVEF
ncbi:MAG: hypothetical protein EPO08_17745 [Rhodospirillaceae bacterium]|nr:MAG: hypothetical protein EPO08_17745 [Rhodospirillaceae bacterium]